MGRTSDASLRKRCVPGQTQFGKFVQAVGRRYSGTYPSGHQNDFVMIGETQPLGSDPGNGRTPMRPGMFRRQLFRPKPSCIAYALPSWIHSGRDSRAVRPGPVPPDTLTSRSVPYP